MPLVTRGSLRCGAAFAHVKQHFGIRQFLLRGLKKVRIEWTWLVSSFNLRTLMPLIQARPDPAALCPHPGPLAHRGQGNSLPTEKLNQYNTGRHGLGYSGTGPEQLPDMNVNRR